MARKLKCQWCALKSEADEMTKVTKGKTNKYYHTKECYPAYLEEIEFKKVEATKKADLYQTVMDIYEIKALPTSYYTQIEDLRHGNRVFNTQIMGKRYRQGYDYELIKDTYIESKDNIMWSRHNKAFQNLAKELNYGLAIVINNIYDVERRKEAQLSREHFKQVNQNTSEENGFEEEDIVEFKTSYKKKEKQKDSITDFLD